MSNFTPQGILSAICLLISLGAQAQAPPADHVGSFTATVTDATHIHFTWSVSSNTPLAEGYVIKARVLPGTINDPAATGATNQLTDELDLSDGFARINVTSGSATSADFPVDAGKSYQFKIYPYVNTGAAKPYFKNTSAPAQSVATTNPDVTIDNSPNGVTSITTTGATINYHINDGGGTNVIERGIVWSTSNPVDINDAAKKVKVNAANITTGGYSQSFTGLPPGTQIYYIAYAINSLGTTQTADGASFTTAPPIPTEHVGSFTASTTDATHIHLQWTESSTGTPATDYLIVGRTLGPPDGTYPTVTNGTPVGDDSNWGDKVAAVNVTAGTTSHDFVVLADTKYEFKIYPYNDNGGSPPYFKTDGTVPTKTASTEKPDVTLDGTPVTGLTTASPASATINYTINSSGMNVTERGIVWSTSTPVNFANATNKVSSTPGPFVPGGYTNTFTNLAPAGTRIYYLAYATSALGTTKTAEQSFFTYAMAPANPIGAITATVLTGTSIRVTFPSLTSTGGANLKGYVILRREAAAPDINSIKNGVQPSGLTTLGNSYVTTITDPVASSYTDNGLSGNTQYYYTVVPFNSNGSNDPATFNYNTTGGLKVADATTLSALADIAYNTAVAATIDYTKTSAPKFPATPGTMDMGNSTPLARFSIRDGGNGATDADNKPTIVESITVDITNFSNINSIALFFDDETASNSDDLYIGTDQYDITSGTITFTPTTPITVADNGRTAIVIRAWMKREVVDNQRIVIKVNEATIPEDGTSSSFTATNAGGVTTTNSENLINVVAGRLKLTVDGSTPSAIGSSFKLVAQAIPHNSYPSIDLNWAAAITLEGSNGKITSTQPLGGRTMVNGQYILWDDLKFTEAGSYSLFASDDTGVLNDATSIPFTIGASAPTITPSINSVMCYSTDYVTIDPIEIEETDNAGFAKNGTNGNALTIKLGLPNGFEFDVTNTSIKPTLSAGGDISTPLNYSYGNASEVTITYNVNSTTNKDKITINGLKVRATNPGFSTAGHLISGNITRTGGSAPIAGLVADDGTSLGTVSADVGAAPTGGISFTVDRVNTTDVIVDPNQTQFTTTSQPVKLVGSQSGGVFSAPQGVTVVGGTQYRFNPNSLTVGTYPVTYTVQSGGCDFVTKKDFVITTSDIENLLPTYCTNSSATTNLTVSSTTVNARYGAGWTFGKLVYYNGSGWVDIAPNTVGGTIFTFNPAAPQYQSVYQVFSSFLGPGIYIGWVPKDINGNYPTPIFYSYIRVNSAQKPSLQLSKTNFCQDEPPITLVGSPANSDNISEDKFTASTTEGQNSISNGGSPLQWSFNPQLLGVTTGTESFNLTYTFTNKSTGCKDTSDPVTITVAARPDAVTADFDNSNQAVCQGGTALAFETDPVAGVSYNWYKNVTLTDPATALPTNTFTPETNTAAAGVTTFYITQTVNGCESNKLSKSGIPAKSVSLTVNATPGPPVTDFLKEYCQNAPINSNDFKINTGANIKWYLGGTAATSTSLLSGATPTLTEIEDPLKLNVSTAGVKTFNFDVTQTVSGCEGKLNPSKVSISILPLPQLGLSASKEIAKICVTGGLVTFSATDGGLPATGATGAGTWSWSGLTGLTNIAGSANATLDPSTVPPGDYSLQFEFKYSTAPPSPQCLNNTSVVVTILPNITASLNPGDACEKSFVKLNNESDIDFGVFGTGVHAPKPNTQISKAQWNFGDGTGLPEGDKDDAVDDGRTKGTYFNPQHKFTSTGAVLLTYTMTTTDGCVVSATKPLIISPKPEASITWKQACSNALPTTAFQVSTNPVLALSTYDWNFSKQGLLSYINPGTGDHPTVNYTGLGVDTVQVIVATQFNCKDTARQVVYIVPNIAPINENNAYTQGFDGGADGWLQGGKKSSWAIGKPSGENIRTDAANNLVWDTNPAGISNTGEQSWVLSPRYNFTTAEKPIFSFDIWSDTPSLNDGAVLQYNEDGDLLNDASWKVLGVKDQGSNWYESTGISSKPGNQSGGDVGWSGQYGGWRHAAYKLDDLRGKACVVFRIAFASGNPRNDGFAFDNIFIGERTRTVLLENFTNSSAAANTRAHNDIFRTFADENTSEVTKVEYHTAFPGNDPINAMNAAINSSRAAFYGLSSPGTFAVDGLVAGTQASMNKVYEDRVLTPAPFKIEVTQVQDGEDVRIATKITNVTNLTIPTSNANVFTVLIEKSINQQSLLGENGDPEFTYVARKMLPNAAGVPLGQDFAPNSTVILPGVMWTELSLLDPAKGAIAIFIQNTQGDDKNVFQSVIVDATVLPQITTGNERPEYVDGVRMYPNPVNGADLTITLPEKAKETLPVRLVDAQGRSAMNTAIPKGNAHHVLTTSELVNGFYIVEIETGKGRFVRKKIMVMH